MKQILSLVAVTLLAACNQSSMPADDPTLENEAWSTAPTAPTAPATDGVEDSMPEPAAAAMTQDDYLGRWTGVEGMYLDVTPKPQGGVTLTMQWDLDHKGTFDGSVTAEGLRFIRDGQPEILVPTDGDATGLKNLAGEDDCLTVKPGEGYCRD